MAELQELKDELGKTFHQYKEQNNKRDKEAKELGEATALTNQKVEKLNDGLDKLGEKIETEENAIKARMDALETAQQRPTLGGESGEVSNTKDGKFTDAYRKEVLLKWCRKDSLGMEPDEIKALTVADDTQAGYLAPTEYVQEIIKGVTEFSPIRTVARVRPIGGKAIQIPKRTGQFSAVWVAEGGTKSETEGYTVGLEEITAHEFYALIDISNTMLEDSAFGLEQEIREETSEQFGVAEGLAFVSGNGVGKPQGLLTNPDVGETNSGSASALTANGLIDLWTSLKSAYAARATWLLNRNSIGAIRKLTDGNDQYLWQPGLVGSVPSAILNSPYVEVTDMPNEGADTYPVLYGDFMRGYLIVDRIAISMQRDPFTRATNGEVRFTARKRVGGQVILAEAIKKQKCSV